MSRSFCRGYCQSLLTRCAQMRQSKPNFVKWSGSSRGSPMAGCGIQTWSLPLMREFSNTTIVMSETSDGEFNTSPTAIQPYWKRNADTPFLMQLSSFKSSRELIEFIELSSANQWDSRAIMVVTRLLFDILKKEPDRAKVNAWRSIGMQKFFRIIKKEVRSLDADELVSLTKLLTSMKVPASNATCQLVLRLLSKQLNLLELNQLIYLHFLLEKINVDEKSPMVEALLVALPVVFESQVDMQLNSNNVLELVASCRYACERSLSREAVGKILSAISGNLRSLDTEQVLSVLRSLIAYPKRLDGFEDNIDSFFAILTRNVDSLSSSDISLMLSRCLKYYMRKHLVNTDFVDACLDRLLSLKDKAAILQCMSYVSIMRHVHVEFLETIGYIIVKDPSVILNDEDLYLTVTRTYSSASYKPEVWDKLEPLLLEHPYLTNANAWKEISVALDFLAIGILPSKMIEKIFSPAYEPELDAWFNKKGPLTLITIYSAVKQLHPEYNGPFPSDAVVEKWNAANNKKELRELNYPFKLAIQSTCGGEQNVSDGLMLNGIFIDHALAVRPDGSFVQVQNHDLDFMKSVAANENAQIVLVKTYGREAFATNTRRLRGIHKLEYKIIESYGYPCVQVSQHEWKVLPEEDKAIFFQEKMKEVLQSLNLAM